MMTSMELSSTGSGTPCEAEERPATSVEEALGLGTSAPLISSTLPWPEQAHEPPDRDEAGGGRSS